MVYLTIPFVNGPLKILLANPSGSKTILEKSKTIYLYAGLGAGSDSVRHTLHTLHDQLPWYLIKTLDAHELISGQWCDDAAAFVMPGGADIFYAKRLKGKGNQVISQYVQTGGVYIGICAGAYYAAEQVCFDDGKGFQVKESRELAFISGAARGPVSGSYDASSYEEAVVTDLEGCFGTGPFFLNGGPSFQEGGEILARYAQYDQRPAIVYTSYGQGKALLSGVHFEYAPDKLDSQDPFLARLMPRLKEGDSLRRQAMKSFWDLLEL